MSLNKTLDRLFDEIRREAKRNPAFADRLDAVMRGHASRRDVDEAALADEAPAPNSSLANEGGAAVAPKPKRGASPQSQPLADISSVNLMAAKIAPPALNPVALFQKQGEEALIAALAEQDHEGLRALVAEHNLDPVGEATELNRDALAAHVVAQAKRRAARDAKLFDY